MAATTVKAEPSQSFLLHGISWKVYDALVNELAEEHVFMTYDRGELEFLSPRPLLLHGISWKLYDALVDELAEQHVFMTYDRGELEFMSPLYEHEHYKGVIGRLIWVLAEEWGININYGGSTTFRRDDLERGLEPDECYWIANEPAIRDKLKIDLSKDPPPDLAVEIETTSKLLDRESIYAALGVPELWRFDGQSLRVFVLGPDGKYLPSDKSLSFPALPLAEFQAYFHRPAGTPEIEWIKTFRQWARNKLKEK